MIVPLHDLAARWKIEIDPVFACALWQGGRDRRDGRALVWRGNKPSQAQRFVYEAEVDAIPDGMELDHTCRRTQCVAPHHAEVVTRQENELRKIWRYRARRTKCTRGHDLQANGAVTPEGGRVCRLCNREALNAE